MKLSEENINFINELSIDDIPWNHLNGAYNIVCDMPIYLRELLSLNDRAAKDAALNIHAEIEHQSTLYQSTPNTLIFLFRILEDLTKLQKLTKHQDILVYRISVMLISIVFALSYWDDEVTEEFYFKTYKEFIEKSKENVVDDSEGFNYIWDETEIQFASAYAFSYQIIDHNLHLIEHFRDYELSKPKAELADYSNAMYKSNSNQNIASNVEDILKNMKEISDVIDKAFIEVE